MNDESRNIKIPKIKNWTRKEIVCSIFVLVVIAAANGLLLFVLVKEILHGPWVTLAFIADIIGIGIVLIALFREIIRPRGERISAEKDMARDLPLLQDVLNMEMDESPEMLRVPPIWADFPSHVYTRPELETLHNLVESYSFVMLLGKSGAGKTTLAHNLGYHLLVQKNNWRFVFYWDAASPGYADPKERLEQAGSILAKHHHGKKALVILDNVHLDSELVANLVTERYGLFCEQLHVLFVARSTSESTNFDTEHWKQGLGVNEALRFLTLEREEFSDAVRGIVQTYSEIRGMTLSFSNENQYESWLTHVEDRCQGSLTLLKFMYQAIEEENLALRNLVDINLASSVGDYYESSIERILNKEDIRRLWQGMPLTGNRYSLAKKCLLLVAIFSSIELPVHRDFIVEIMRRNVPAAWQGDPRVIQLLNAMLHRLHDNGDLVVGAGADQTDSFMLPHTALAEALPSSFHRLFRSSKISFPDVGRNVHWPFEHGVVALVQFLNQHGYLAELNKVDRITNLNPFSDEKYARAMRGYFVERRINYRASPEEKLELGLCYIALLQTNEAIEVIEDAISYSMDCICRFDRMYEGGLGSNLSQQVQETADEVHQALYPWTSTQTELSGPLLNYDIHDYIDIKGDCPYCGTTIYGCCDIPVPNRYGKNIAGTEECEMTFIECPICIRNFEFTVYNNVAHSFFNIVRLPLGLNIWEFSYRERCQVYRWH